MTFRKILAVQNAQEERSPLPQKLWPLSRAGKKQARHRRKVLDYPTFDLVLHSGSASAKETAEILASLDLGKQTPFVEVPALLHIFEPGLEDTRKRLGEVAPQAYVGELGNAITDFAETAAEQLENEMHRCEARNVLIVGNGIFLPLVCQQLTSQDDPFLTQVLREFQGYRFTLKNGEAVDTVRIVR